MTNINLTADISGVISLIASLAAISPAVINLYKFSSKYKKLIWQIAHAGLMTTICLGLIHGLLSTQLNNINFYDLNTYWVYAGGLFTFNLFAFWAFMYTELKLDPKKLNYLSYGALFLLACHIGQQIIPTF